MVSMLDAFSQEVQSRLRKIDELAQAGALDAAIDIFVTTLAQGGVIHAYGTGHSEAFAMEIAGRAGGFIPTHLVGLRDLVLLGDHPVGDLAGATLERDPGTADDVYDLYVIQPQDCFIIASNSGANPSTVGVALRAKAAGLPVIAVTSLLHSQGVVAKHPSGQRLFEVADVVIDNQAPYGDATLDLNAELKIGAVSSIIAAYIAQLLTIGTAARMQSQGVLPPMYISANIPGGDEHNNVLEDRYGARIKPYAHLDQLPHPNN